MLTSLSFGICRCQETLELRTQLVPLDVNGECFTSHPLLNHGALYHDLVKYSTSLKSEASITT